MHFLTFDTSLDKTYLTLFNEKNAIDTEIIETHDDKYHSAYLIQNLVNLLKKHNLTVKNIEAIGVNIGPGSFTGIRACLTIARVIAQQLEIPLVGVPSTVILAQINKNKNKTIVLMDARKGMCYFAEYDNNGEEIQEPHLEPIETLSIPDESTIISDKVMQNFLKEQEINSICFSDINEDLGVLLGSLTYKKLQKGSYHWAKVKPLYLQKPSITISKKNLI
ncbi:tRNA (adenosine(37)-N6)-threonylcarbamoyltransferase complex dimerization subunit type 1 TsaB [bacterium]|nr:tRNA (adenosine(37)-N6)-threonylcarbamoyltransferase complex dimerization subunit type 1 TsaB [bacterium]